MKCIAVLFVIFAFTFAEKKNGPITTCELCKLVLPPLKENLGLVEKLVATKVGQPCNRITEKFRPLCQQIATKNIGRVGDIIKENEIEKSCEKFQLCGAFDRKLTFAILCDGVRALHDYADELAEIVGSDAEELCESMPELDATLCTTMPQEALAGARLLRHYIRKFCGMLPFYRCEIGVEGLSKKQRFLSMVRTKDGKNIGTNIACKLCETLVNWLKNAIANPTAHAHDAVRDAILAALTDTCNALPILDAQCEYLVEYIKENYDILYDILNPSQLCPYIGCPSEGTKSK